MRACQIQGSFGVEHLGWVERPDPTPGAGEVVVQMRAASLNYRDLLMITGKYNPRQPLPLVPLSDGVGEVIAVGQGVSRVRVGERVAAIFAQTWLDGAPNREALKSTLGGPRDGVLAEQIVLSEHGVVRVPSHLTDVQAATLPCAAVTAWRGLVEQGGVKPGETVLVQGTGGVSIFALQFALLAGARVIVTSSDDAKLERARTLGAWATINYRSVPAWGKRALELTGGAGVDHVIEVGGTGTLAQSMVAVRPGGHISVIGILGGATSEVNLLPILMQNLRLLGVVVGSRANFEAMNRAIEAHRLVPVVDRVLPWTDVHGALAHLASGQHFGKVCLQF